MKKTRYFVKLTIVSMMIFCVFTLFTRSIMRPADGNNEYGFPMRFYFEYSNFCSPTPDCTNQSELFYLPLMLDIGFAIGITALLFGLCSFLKHNS